MKKVNIRKQLKYILRDYGIKQEDLYYRFGWYFKEVNNELLEDLKRQLDDNSKKIIENMNKIHQNSGALDILKDFKGDNKRLFVILMIILVMWFSTIVYLVYVLRDTGTFEERLQEIDSASIEYSDIINGDYYGED